MATAASADLSLTNNHWRCSQHLEDSGGSAISSVAFDDTAGDTIAVGDTTGGVRLYRNDASVSGLPHYEEYFNFEAHEAEFDALKSVDISERVNCVRWLPKHAGVNLLTCNDKTVKLWKVGAVPKSVRYTSHKSRADTASGALVFPKQGPPRLPGVNTATHQAKLRRAFRNAHNYTMHSISCCSDGEMFLSADDLRIYLWSLERHDECFMMLDLKPDNMEDLTEVATCAKFHPQQCSMFAYSNSLGEVKMHDMREGARCTGREPTISLRPEGGGVENGMFDELVASISDFQFGGRFVFVRDFLTVRVWDITMPRAPVQEHAIGSHLKSRLGELWESERIFDRFEIACRPDGSELAGGSYGDVCTTWSPDRAEARTSFVAGLESRTTPAAAGTEQADLDRSVLSLAWHPRERLMAMASNNTLFIHHVPKKTETAI